MFLSYSLHIFYNFLTNLIAVFSVLFHKLGSNIKAKNRNQCYKNVAKSKNILFYAASMGEALSVVSFVKEINEKYKDFNIIIATQTHSSANTVAKYIKQLGLKNTYHVYAVLDASFLVKDFLQKINPRIVFWVESEFWYNHLRLIKKQNIPLILLNARFSPRALEKWKKFDFILKKLLSHFDIITAKTQSIADSIKQITSYKASFIGDIKVSSSLFVSNSLLCTKLENLNFVENRKPYLAISTHDDEELKLAQVHSNIKKQYDDFLTIIIPRHVERAESIASKITEQNLKAVLLSKITSKDHDCDILIIDSYGKVKDISSLVGLAFVGKSLSSKVIGGQNPCEPVFFGLDTIIGPNYQNFAEDIKNLKKYSLIKEVADIQELEQEIVDNLFNNKTNAKDLESYLENIEAIAKKHLLFFESILDEQNN